MFYNTVITSDLHLTDNPRDEYRWELFRFLIDFCGDNNIEHLYILGDVTDATDKHSFSLVNRVVEHIADLAGIVDEITILKGNHDYTTGQAFFSFMDYIDGVRFIEDITDDGGITLFLPHTRDPEVDWAKVDFRKFDNILMHETAKGSVVSNGMKMPTGIDGDLKVQDDVIVVSGDIHVPQKVGDIIYCGSPYHVHFGDRFTPRILHFDYMGEMHSVETNFAERFVVNVSNMETLENLKLRKGDMVKVRFHLQKSDVENITTWRKQVTDHFKERDIEVSGIEIKFDSVEDYRDKVLDTGRTNPIPIMTAEEIVREYAKRERLSENVRDVGLFLLSAN